MSITTQTGHVEFDIDLIKKYDTTAPRYTSYPTAVDFTQAFTLDDYQQQIAQSNQSGRNLSLYTHIPFCNTVCYYCGCSKIVTQNRDRATPYLQRLHREISLQAECYDKQRTVDQLHWGGGTPTFINMAQMTELFEHTRRHFNFADDQHGEYSIELDPREVRSGELAQLRQLGFNRLSLGIQDFDENVQRAVNRVQSKSESLAMIAEARDLGFRSISTDLIYGLPKQTPHSFEQTLESLVSAQPDRLSVFNYAHLPHMFKPQRRIDENDLPSADQKLAMMQMIIAYLQDHGYIYIGMDHFAKPDDELAIAQRDGTLYRNFQGYATKANRDMIGFGMTSIGQVANCYVQNYKTEMEYYAAIDAGHLPVLRGITLTDEDVLLRYVITQLICEFYLDYTDINVQFNIDCQTYFASELNQLRYMQEDGLLQLHSDRIQVTDLGKLMIRNICYVFDQRAHMRVKTSFSKVL